MRVTRAETIFNAIELLYSVSLKMVHEYYITFNTACKVNDHFIQTYERIVGMVM